VERVIFGRNHLKYPRAPEKSGALRYQLNVLIAPFTESSGGSDDEPDPIFVNYSTDETAPDWSGGSETGITSSSFALEEPLERLRY
jgi:hypothetical protein